MVSALRSPVPVACLVLLVCAGCSDDTREPTGTADAEPTLSDDGGVREDAGGERDAGSDGGGTGASDAAAGDAATAQDAASPDAGEDAAAEDAAVDEEPPVLESSTPADGDDNVDARQPLSLAFSEPVVLGDGALALRQTTPSGDVAFTAMLGADGRSVTITLDEPLDLPAELTLSIGAGITDAAGNPLEPTELRFTVPVWLRLGGALNRVSTATASDLQLVIDDQGRAVLLSVEDADVYASRLEDGAFQPLGDALNASPTVASAVPEPRLSLALDAGGEPMVALRLGSGVAVVGWDGSAWQPLGADADPDGGGSHAPALALDADGEPIVAFDAVDGSAPVVQLRGLSGSTWQTLDSLAVTSSGVRLAGDGSDPTLAYQETGTGIFALRWDGGALVPLGGGAALPAAIGRIALSVSGAQDMALSARAEGTVLWGAGSWDPIEQDLGFQDSSTALERVLAHAPDGALLSAFDETPMAESASRVYVQRLGARRFTTLGPALNRDRDRSASHPALAVDAQGTPVVAWLEAGEAGGAPQIFASRFNGDPARPPYGLRVRAYTPECLATLPAVGSLLTDTGCFADTLGREPAAGFVPFDVRSPLWSDGAFKRRFFMLPEDGTIEYRDPGIWTFPEGTIVIKEFAIEGRRGDRSTLRPVETRFLVVHDTGEWDRYSYQWDQDATQAVLRPATGATATFDFAIQDELGAATTQTHFYPTRPQCLSCHEGPGTVLGPQTVMLNRNLEYATTVDNQLRAMQRLGLFAASFDPETARAMPSPTDATYSTEARLRAALHANCSGCHHPLMGMNLPAQIATLDTGLCDKIVKGDLNGSVIYWRDVLRGYPPDQEGVAPMPPLGTLQPNPLLEELLTDWILDPSNPCP